MIIVLRLVMLYLVGRYGADEGGKPVQYFFGDAALEKEQLLLRRGQDYAGDLHVGFGQLTQVGGGETDQPQRFGKEIGSADRLP